MRLALHRGVPNILPDSFPLHELVGAPCYDDLQDGSVKAMEDDEELPYISGSGEGLMEEGTGMHTAARRNEDIALDLMKFVAMTTGYGRTSSSGVGFQGSGAASKPEDYANHLLELYGRCLEAVQRKK
jgi:hypothetical protein